MPRLGLHLPNRHFLPGEWERIRALGCTDYVDLHWFADRWQMIKESQPNARIHARIDVRGPLGNPTEEARDTAQKVMRYGQWVDTWRRRNEVNLESPGVLPEQWERWLKGYFAALDDLMPGRKHNVPAPSPGVAGWQAYVIIIAGHQNDAHAYGNQQEVETALAPYPKGSLITEWNFGAGRPYSLEQWARDLTNVMRSSTLAIAEALIVFIWDWANADMQLPTKVNVVGTPIETAIKEWNGKVSTWGLKGIDVASHQGKVDWEAVAKSGRDFAFTKATQGADYINPTFAENWKGIKAAGMARGAYHYFTEANPYGQAHHFLDTVGPTEPGDMFVLDIEVPQPDLLDRVLAWLAFVHDYSGIKPILYSRISFMKANGLLHPTLADYPLWLAFYSSFAPDPPAPWTVLSFWQFSDACIVPGVKGLVDGDFAFISKERLHLLGKPASVVEDTAEQTEAQMWKELAEGYGKKLRDIRAVLNEGVV